MSKSGLIMDRCVPFISPPFNTFTLSRDAALPRMKAPASSAESPQKLTIWLLSRRLTQNFVPSLHTP
jgi:hypothetical protein